MVDLSDHGDLMEIFLALPMPRLFLYGEQNASLSYLPHLRRHGVELAVIEQSGHWPMYANPVATWRAIARFVDRADAEGGRPL
jgi:pimeloyl-ACP methyl ester carboxylesterase